MDGKHALHPVHKTREYIPVNLYMCPACKSLMEFDQMYAGGCSDNIKNSKEGMVFHCCGEAIEGYPHGMIQLFMHCKHKKEEKLGLRATTVWNWDEQATTEEEDDAEGLLVEHPLNFF